MALLSDNLVSFWKLDESSGNAADSKGSNTLTNNNSTAFAAGKLNNGADFESTSSNYLSITDAAQSGLDITGDLSFSYWYKPESLPGASEHTILSKWDSQRSYLIQHTTDIGAGIDGIAVSVSDDGTDKGAKTFALTMSTGTWYHIVIVYTAAAGTVDCYINGVAQTQATGAVTSIFNSNALFSIGSQGGSVRFADGIIDEVGIWNRPLVQADVTKLYNSGNAFAYPWDFVLSYLDTVTASDSTAYLLAASQTETVTMTDSVVQPDWINAPKSSASGWSNQPKS